MPHWIATITLILGLAAQVSFATAASTSPAAPMGAPEIGQIRLGDDYAQFYIGGSDWHPCQKECSDDISCKAWTYLSTTGQCRLKHSVVPGRSNSCCVSGVKQATTQTATQNTSGVGSDEQECTKLSVAAINANDDNLANQCGLTGALWSSAYADHYSHCLDSSPRRRTRDADERQQALAACQQDSSQARQLTCDHYARMAVAESATNAGAQCGLAGPAWSPSYNEHFQWCQAAAPSVAASQTTGREHQLLACLSRGGGQSRQDCDAFATSSVSQFTQAARQRCDPAFSGPQWSNDHALHYRWCISHSQAERDDVTRQRSDALAQCSDDRNHLRLIFKF